MIHSIDCGGITFNIKQLENETITKYHTRLVMRYMIVHFVYNIALFSVQDYTMYLN